MSDQLAEVDRLSAAAVALFDAGRIPEAAPLFRRALAEAEAAVGPDDLAVGRHVFRLGRLYDEQGKEDRARDAFRRALRILETHLGPDHPDLIEVLQHLGPTLWRKEYKCEREECYQWLIRLVESRPNNEELLVRTLCDAGYACYWCGDRASGERHLQRALELAERAFGPDHLLVAECCHRFMYLYRGGQLGVDPLPFQRREVAIREAVQGPTHPDVGVAIYQLAFTHYGRDELEVAAPLFARAASIWKVNRSQWTEIRWMVDGYRRFLQQTGRTAELAALDAEYPPADPSAECGEFFSESLAFKQAVLEPDDPDLAKEHFHTANRLRYEQKFVEAESHYLRVLTLYEAAHGPDHPDVAEVLQQLGRMYSWTDQFTESELLLDRALAIQVRAHGPASREAANVMEDRALLEAHRGRFDDGDRWYRSALAIYEVVFEPDSYAWAESLWKFGEFLLQGGRTEEALSVGERLVPLAEKWAPRGCSALDYLTVRTRALFALGRMDEFHAAVRHLQGMATAAEYDFTRDPEWLTGVPADGSKN